METQKLADVTMEAAADSKADVGDDWLRMEIDQQLMIDYWWVTNTLNPLHGNLNWY